MKVLRMEPYHFPVEEQDIDDNGEFNSERGLIVVRRGLTQDAYADTLLHEVGHASSYVAGVASLLLTDFQEEQYLRATIPYMLSALRNNRWLRRALGLEG